MNKDRGSNPSNVEDIFKASLSLINQTINHHIGIPSSKGISHRISGKNKSIIYNIIHKLFAPKSFVKQYSKVIDKMIKNIKFIIIKYENLPEKDLIFSVCVFFSFWHT